MYDNNIVDVLSSMFELPSVKQMAYHDMLQQQKLKAKSMKKSKFNQMLTQKLLKFKQKKQNKNKNINNNTTLQKLQQ